MQLPELLLFYRVRPDLSCTPIDLTVKKLKTSVCYLSALFRVLFEAVLGKNTKEVTGTHRFDFSRIRIMKI